MNVETNQKVKQRRFAFTPEEDARLHTIVQIYHENWKAIASFMGTRTPRQCRERYLNYLAPGLVNDRWTSQEDQLLLEKQRIFGKRWIYIAQFFPRRSAANIKNRWAQLVKKGRYFAQQFQNNLIRQQERLEPVQLQQIPPVVQSAPEEKSNSESEKSISLPSIHEFEKGNLIHNLINRSILKNSLFSNNESSEKQILPQLPPDAHTEVEQPAQRSHSFKRIADMFW